MGVIRETARAKQGPDSSRSDVTKADPLAKEGDKEEVPK